MQMIETQGGSVKLVTWDGCYEKKDWFSVPNRFRDGDQSNLLIRDKHSDAYASASPEEKERLERMANPP